MAATAARKLPPSYFRLVRRFPLVQLQTEEELTTATEVMHDLSAKELLDDGEQAYFDLLCQLIGDYEDQQHAIPSASEGDVLQFLLDSNGLSANQLGPLVGVSSAVLAGVLAGTRSLNRGQIEKIAAHFKVSGAVFLAAPNGG